MHAHRKDTIDLGKYDFSIDCDGGKSDGNFSITVSESSDGSYSFEPIGELEPGVGLIVDLMEICQIVELGPPDTVSVSVSSNGKLLGEQTYEPYYYQYWCNKPETDCDSETNFMSEHYLKLDSVD